MCHTQNTRYKSEIASLKSTVGAGQESEQKLKTATAEVEKLKGALKQSSANVGQWQKQIAQYQAENQELKTKVQKMIDLQKGFASVLS